MGSITVGRGYAAAGLAALALFTFAGSAQAQSRCEQQLREVSRLAREANTINNRGEWTEACNARDVRLLRQMIQVQERLVPLSRRYIECDPAHEAKFTRVFAKNLADYRKRLANCE